MLRCLKAGVACLSPTWRLFLTMDADHSGAVTWVELSKRMPGSMLKFMKKASCDIDDDKALNWREFEMCKFFADTWFQADQNESQMRALVWTILCSLLTLLITSWQSRWQHNKARKQAQTQHNEARENTQTQHKEAQKLGSREVMLAAVGAGMAAAPLVSACSIQ